MADLDSGARTVLETVGVVKIDTVVENPCLAWSDLLFFWRNSVWLEPCSRAEHSCAARDFAQRKRVSLLPCGGLTDLSS